MEPRISIITATYNSAVTINDTLKGVAGQTWPNIEHLIIDGLSTDNTLDIVRKYPHVAKVHSGKDKGIYDAMNKGIALATGDVIGILNSDDFYSHDKVLEKVGTLFMDPKVQAVYADLVYVDAIDTRKVIRYWKSGGYSSQNFYYGWMPPHPTFFVRRSHYEQFGTYNVSLKSAADYELMLRFLVRYEIPAVYIPEVTVKMRTGGVSNASLRNRWRANREDRKAWDINGLTPYFFTLLLKPFRKISQFIIKY